ncbi:hypothetical protein MFIFM68171_09366 [Madurella fahalii]|uniref:Uncharacterized protein n=1 Tax=Madurella fahalii TaxID=1157608 RepID=A0ABQ0GN16_9PEZI
MIKRLHSIEYPTALAFIPKSALKSQHSTAEIIFIQVLLASLALVPALALPTPQVEGEIFSFGKWIEGIIENPDGDNLTPDEAVAAWKASLNGTHADVLEKRGGYNNLVGSETRHQVPDAVWCINRLANLGHQGVMCGAAPVAQMCIYESAIILGAAGGGVTDTASICNDVARAGGFIMDRCQGRWHGARMGHGLRQRPSRRHYHGELNSLSRKQHFVFEVRVPHSAAWQLKIHWSRSPLYGLNSTGDCSCFCAPD